jgi:hypothetical protein
MAFRIHDSVVCGVIDNCVKGIVAGKVWVAGRVEPIVLELKGNAWPDLAGCLLTFRNPQKALADPHVLSLNLLQRGTIGDITASRKVRVFDVPLEQALEMFDRKEKPPEHMANSIYLEWFSDANGRVVIESADYEVTISAPEWRMTPEENEERAKQAAAGMANFMQRLTDAIERQHAGQKDPDEEWDEHDYEKYMRLYDARLEKYGELLDKYGDSEEAEGKIAKEMGWEQEQQDEEQQNWIEEMPAIGEEALNEPPPEHGPQQKGIDSIRTPDRDAQKQLQHRCFEIGNKFLRAVERLDPTDLSDKDLDEFIGEFERATAKLGAALSVQLVAPGEHAFIVAYLKRALGHLHRSHAALEAIASKKLLPETTIAEACSELLQIREGFLRLMDNFRGRT